MGIIGQQTRDEETVAGGDQNDEDVPVELQVAVITDQTMTFSLFVVVVQFDHQIAFARVLLRGKLPFLFGLRQFNLFQHVQGVLIFLKEDIIDHLGISGALPRMLFLFFYIFEKLKPFRNISYLLVQDSLSRCLKVFYEPLRLALFPF